MPFSSEDEILLRRMRIADLYLKGWSQARIAAEVGVTQQQISLDMAAIRGEWRETMLDDFNEKKSIELAKIDNLEAIDSYWKAWADSMKPIKKQRKKYKGRVNPGLAADKQQFKDFDTTDSTEERQGNCRYLDGVLRCIEKRVEILGLAGPAKQPMEEKNLPSWIYAARPRNN